MALSQSTIPVGNKGGSTSLGYPAIYNNNINALLTWSASVPDNFQIAGLQDLDVLEYDNISGNWVNKTKSDADLASKATADTHYAKEVDDTDTDTTKDKHISNALAKTYTDHVANTSNPHTVTPAQVGNTTAQWNADQIQGVDVDDTLIADTLVLQYDNASGDLIYGLANADRIESVDVDNSAIADNFGLLYNSTSGNLEYVNLDKDTAQWDASKIQGVTIDDTNIADDRVLIYNSTSGNLEYGNVTLSAGGAIDGGTAPAQSTAIQIRRDSNTDWTTENTVLSDGEIGFITDTRLAKIGDGSTAWNDLPYLILGAAESGEANTMSNVGTGAGEVYKQKSGVDFQMRTIKAGNNIILSNNTDDITISALSDVGGTDATFSISNSVDNTKIIGFDASGITTGTTRTITMPDEDITLIGETSIQLSLKQSFLL